MLSHEAVTMETLANAFPETFSDVVQDKSLCKRLQIIGN